MCVFQLRAECRQGYVRPKVQLTWCTLNAEARTATLAFFPRAPSGPPSKSPVRASLKEPRQNLPQRAPSEPCPSGWPLSLASLGSCPLTRNEALLSAPTRAHAVPNHGPPTASQQNPIRPFILASLPSTQSASNQVFPTHPTELHVGAAATHCLTLGCGRLLTPWQRALGPPPITLLLVLIHVPALHAMWLLCHLISFLLVQAGGAVRQRARGYTCQSRRTHRTTTPSLATSCCSWLRGCTRSRAR